MAKRAGPSISVKMILTSTLLILGLVVGFGALNVLNIRGAYDDGAREKTELFKRDLKDKGQTVTPVAAQALVEFLADNQDEAIVNFVKDTAKQDPGLRLAYVLDKNRGVIIHCRVIRDVKPDEICDRSTYKPTDQDPHPQIKEESWDKLLTVWSKQKEPLATDEMRDGNVKIQVVGYPIALDRSVASAQLAAAETAGDQRLGYVVFGYDLTPIDAFAKESEKQKKEASYQAAVRTGAVGALFVLIGTVLSIIQGLSISKPLKLLAWKADQIARGDLDARVEVKSTDEIGILGENFNFMADQIVVLLHQTAEKAVMEKELEVARTIQETLVPTHEPVENGFFKFAGYFQPASQCGGDWWTWHQQVGDKVLVVIGDVTGHGVPSAMITAAAKAACDVARSVTGDDVSVTRLLEIMNYAIYESAKRKFVMTCFASLVDTKRRSITYANAGHNFPYLYRAGEDGKGEFGSLMIRGNRLGDLRESKYEAKTTELLPGDILVWYTDGIVECENAAGEEYGEKRFRSSVRRAAALEAGEMRDAIVADSTAFFGETPRKDDITLVVGRIQ